MDLKSFDEGIRKYCEEEKISGALRLTLKDEIIYQANFGYANDEEKHI